MVKLASFNSVVDRLEHGWAGQLQQCCWQAWTWLSWPGWTVLLTGLFMHVGTNFWWHEQTDLKTSWSINSHVHTLTIEHVFREWWNNKIEQRCYNHELGCCMYHVVTYANKPCRRKLLNYVETWLNNTIILPILFYHVNSAVKGLLSQQPCNSLWYFYACRITINTFYSHE